MSKIKVPCHNCERRTSTCHSECEAYEVYRKENAKRNAAIKSAQYADAEMREYVVRNINRQRRTKEKTHMGWNKGG